MINGGNHGIKVYWIFGKYWGVCVLYSAQHWLLDAFWNIAIVQGYGKLSIRFYFAQLLEAVGLFRTYPVK